MKRHQTNMNDQIKVLMFDVYETIATWKPSRDTIQSRAISQFGVNFQKEAIDTGYAVADAHMAQISADRPLRSMSIEERDMFFAQFEQMVLKEGGFNVDLDLASRIWKAVADQDYDLAPYDDVIENFHKLRKDGYKIGIISNMNLSGKQLATNLGLIESIDFAITSEEVGATKPDPQIFHEALHRANDTHPRNAMMIGDQPATDMSGADAAGMKAILMDRYDTHAGYSKHPRVRSMEELHSFLNNLDQQR